MNRWRDGFGEMKRAWISIACLPLFLAWAGASLAAEAVSTPFPPLPGSDLTAQTCTRCHGAEVITKRGRTPEEWRRMVELMIRFGAKVSDDDKPVIIDYLSQAFPPKPQPAAPGSGDPK